MSDTEGDESEKSETEYEKCGKCNIEIKTLSMSCDGFCNKKFHLKCTNASYNIAKFVSESNNYKYHCDQCIKDPETMINTSIKKTLRYMCMLDERMKRQETSNENVLKQLECLNEVITQISGRTISGTNIQEKRETETFASVTKSNPIKCVIIKPKTKQKNIDTRAVMNKKLSKPDGVNVCNVKNVSRGGVVIKYESLQDSYDIELKMIKELGDEYTVTVPTKRNPKIKLSGMSEKVSNHEIEKIIQSRIENVGFIKVLNVYEDKRHMNYGAIIEVDPVTLKTAVDNNNKIIIGWDVCNVTEYHDVRRCYNCCGFNHMAKDCKRKKSCLKCGGQHILRDCKSVRSECVNCRHAVNKLQLKLDVNHPAWSKECAVYKRKIELERRCITSN